MTGDTNKIVDIDKLLSFANDLIDMLNDGKDGENLMQFFENVKSLQSFCETTLQETNISLDEYQKRINGCKERIQKIKGEVIPDSELNELQTELDGKLQLEHLLREGLREADEESGNLEQLIISFEDRWQVLKQKRENDLQKLENSLSMCASVTGIIPDHTNKTKISGFIIERSKKIGEKFELDPEMPPFEVCDKLWKMSSQ